MRRHLFQKLSDVRKQNDTTKTNKKLSTIHFLSAALGNSANESNLRENKPLSNVTAGPRRERKCKSFGGGCHSNRSSSARLSVYLEIVDNRESATLTFYYRTGQKLSFNSLRQHTLSKALSGRADKNCNGYKNVHD